MNNNIPQIWGKDKNRPVFILGGGPTMLDCINGNRPRLCTSRVLGVNLAYTLGYPLVDACFFGDAKFYWWNKDGIGMFGGMKITRNRGVEHGYDSVEGQPGLIIVKRGKQHGIDDRKGQISWNASSGGAAINVAYHLGARYITLVGYDMRLVGGEKNWMEHTKEETKRNPYANFLRPFDKIANDAKRLGVRIVNATPGSAITQFPMTTVDEVLDANSCQ